MNPKIRNMYFKNCRAERATPRRVDKTASPSMCPCYSHPYIPTPSHVVRPPTYVVIDDLPASYPTIHREEEGEGGEG